jgi:shikimate dehydrogenase
MSTRNEQLWPNACDLAIRGSTQIVGVIGWPIAHSVSPPMQNAALRHLGLDWCYVPLPVRPDHLPAAISGLRALGLRGINATVPHKLALLDLVDELTPAARAIGAVNTVVVGSEALLGHNTDAAGFIRDLREQGFDSQGCRALVLGAGGAARAVVYALASVGADVVVVNRTTDKAELLAHDMAQRTGGHVRAVALTTAALAEEGACAQLVVNTTPLGMWPHVADSPWPEGLAFPSNALCYDLIYNPRQTRLWQQAQQSGARAVDGLGMLVHQGAEALELWTGREAPIAVMRAACEAVLGTEQPGASSARVPGGDG